MGRLAAASSRQQPDDNLRTGEKRQNGREWEQDGQSALQLTNFNTNNLPIVPEEEGG